MQIAPLWPFDDRDPKLLQMMIPHHLCALIITLPAICNGMHEMEDAQLIGASLLLAGGMTDAIVCLTRTRDRRDPVQAWQEVGRSSSCLPACLPAYMYRHTAIIHPHERLSAGSPTPCFTPTAASTSSPYARTTSSQRHGQTWSHTCRYAVCWCWFP